MKKIPKLVKKYLPDIILIAGVLIASFNILRPTEQKGGVYLPSIGYTDYHTNEKVFGILLIVIGIDMVIRKYLSSKNERKN